MKIFFFNNTVREKKLKGPKILMMRCFLSCTGDQDESMLVYLGGIVISREVGKGTDMKSWCGFLEVCGDVRLFGDSVAGSMWFLRWFL